MGEQAGEEFEIHGDTGELVARRWPASSPEWVALLVHGYGEHVGRYEWLAARLSAAGAAVYGIDHVGHGRSGGERVLVDDFEPVVSDVHRLAERAASEHSGLPLVLVGHSMGGMIGARYAQRHGSELAAVVLSGPVLGRWDAVTRLLDAEEIPATPIDPATLSRDPAVGAAYETDPLVWHGAFKRPTLQALVDAMDTIAADGAVTDVPVLWLHGEDDRLVPIEGTREGWTHLAGVGSTTQQKTYPGVRHEIFNETNKEEVVDDLLSFVGPLVGR